MTDYSLQDFEGLIKKHGSGRKAAAAIGMPRSTFQDTYKRLRNDNFISKNNVSTISVTTVDSPEYFIITSAQDGTKVHEQFLDNLKAYCRELGATLIVSGFTYNKSLFEDHSKTKTYFHESILPFMTNDRIKIGEELMVCCEMNTLPTAVNPLSGFHNYTGMRSGIFPHPKVQLESVPTMKGEPAKVLMTTGAVTLPNYVPKKAGIKAEYHHIIGAVIVELKTDGGFFARHLIADSDGSFYDLDRKVQDGKVTKGHRVEAITWGDIHCNKLDVAASTGAWGHDVAFKLLAFSGSDFDEIDKLPEYTPMSEMLQPKHQFFHDVLDFEVRNHHNIKDHLFIYKQKSKCPTVEEEIVRVADFIVQTKLPDCTSVIVESNHDLALERWLKTADYRTDPDNAVFFLEGVTKLYKNAHVQNYSILYDLLSELVEPSVNVLYLTQDESYRICAWDKGGIECGLHGHNGLNGARSNSKSYTKLGVRVNSGHEHSAKVYEGVYVAGITAKLEHGYNVGPSSWSHSHIITYDNAKRTIVTQDVEGKFTTLN